MKPLLHLVVLACACAAPACATAGPYQTAGDDAYAEKAGSYGPVPAQSSAQSRALADEFYQPQTMAVQSAPSNTVSGAALGNVDVVGEPEPPAPPRAPPPPPPEQGGPHKPAAEAPRPARLMIYTAQLAVIVPAVDVAVEAFVKRTTEIGGYLQGRSDGIVTVRVPASHFFPVIDELRRSGVVTQENIQAQDVTREVFDTELRLQTAEESRKRLLKILETAAKTEDILRIEQEVRRLTEEIELLKGQLRHLRDQVAFSTLAVNFQGSAPAPTPYPKRTRSRFGWINAVGVEQVLHGF